MTAYFISTWENKTAENEVCAPVRKGSHSSLAAAVKGDFWGTMCSESLGLESWMWDTYPTGEPESLTTCGYFAKVVGWKMGRNSESEDTLFQCDYVIACVSPDMLWGHTLCINSVCVSICMSVSICMCVSVCIFVSLSVCTCVFVCLCDVYCVYLFMCMLCGWRSEVNLKRLLGTGSCQFS